MDPLLHRRGCLGAAVLAVLLAQLPGAAAQAGVAGASAKDVTSSLPAFEVASVRPVGPSGRGTTELSPYGTSRFSFRNASFRNILQLAYNTDHIEGTPKGFEDAYYDIEAKTEGDLPLTYELLQPRLRHLLQQRFGLVGHMVERPSSGLALVIAKGGSKLTSSAAEANAHAYIFSDRLDVTGGSMGTMAGVLSIREHQPVVDLTGLTGKYDVELKFAPVDATDSPYPSLYTALKEQLGLELKPHTVTVKMLVIDHLDLTPSEN